MATTKPYARNDGSQISGTTQVGNIAIGVNGTYDFSTQPGGVTWYMGPDEERGYLIVHPDASELKPRFKGTIGFSDQLFLDLANEVAGIMGQPPFSGATDAQDWLSLSGFPTTYEGYDSEASALFTRMSEEPSNDLKELINKTIVDLKSCGIWDITDKFHKWDLHTQQASLLDWKNSANDAIAYNSPYFTKAYGVQTVDATNYLDLRLVPSTGCTYATLNDTAFSIDDKSGALTPQTYNFGSYNTGNTSTLLFRTKESNTQRRPWTMINALTWQVFNNRAGADRIFYCQRVSSSTISLYLLNTTSGESASNTSSTSVATIDQNLILGGFQNSSGTKVYSNIHTSTFWMGSIWQPYQRQSYYDIITYWNDHIRDILPWTYGDEIVSNGTFDDATDWTLYTGWTISGGVASWNHWGAQRAINTLAAPISGDSRYMISFTLSNITNPSGLAYLLIGTSGGAAIFLSPYNGNYNYFTSGTTSFLTTAVINSDYVAIWASGASGYNNNYTFDIDDFSIKRITNL